MYGAAAALLMVRPPNLWLAILYGLVGSAGIALFVAYFSTRLRDIYFAITTLIFSQIFYVIIFTWTEVTGGENGLSFRRPALGIPGIWTTPFTAETLHWFVLAIVAASYLILRRITQSPFGMVLQSIRENEPRTRAIGYPVERYKIMAVMLSGVFAGLAGVGDLIATCMSPLSRNRKAGELIATGIPWVEAERQLTGVAEGVVTAAGALELAAIHEVELPIAAQVRAVLTEGRAPLAAVAELMGRTPKDELAG